MTTAARAALLAVALLACRGPAESPAVEGPTTLLPSRTVAAPTTVTTQPVAASALVLGDFGTGSRAEHRVAEAMRAFSSQHDVRAIITTGDNFYTDDVEAVWDRPFGWVEEDRIPVWPSWGNHDLETTERRRLVEEELSPPGRWYARDLGQATVIILDGNQPSDAGQLAWLENMLASRVQRPVMVVAHQPPLSCSEHGSTPVLQELWVPLLERFAAELVLSGHDHNYQRFRQSGITYVVSGGGGAGLYAMESCPRGTPPPLAADDTHHHFLVLSVTEDLIQVEARAADGQVLDRFSVDERLP